MRSDSPREIMEAFLQAHLPNVNVIADAGRVTRLENKPGITICDFCGDVPGPHIFAAATIMVDTIIVIDEHGSSGDEYESVGDWGACDACAVDIRANNRSALVERALKHGDAEIDTFVPAEQRAEVDAVRRLAIANSHAAFFHARK